MWFQPHKIKATHLDQEHVEMLTFVYVSAYTNQFLFIGCLCAFIWSLLSFDFQPNIIKDVENYWVGTNV